MATRRLEAVRRLAAVDTPIIPTIAGLARAQPGTISLGQGVVNFGPPVDIGRALSALQTRPELLRYQSATGMPELLDALKRKLRDENGIDFDPERHALMATAGSNMAFLQALMATTDPGDEVILPTPFYFNHEMAIRMLGCVPRLVPTRADHQLDIDALFAAVTPRTRVIVTISPNNPSGAVYPEADLREVNRRCAELGLWHFSDEAYEYFVHDGATHWSPASDPSSAAHTLSFMSFSKTYGMASWRLGYCLYPKALEADMTKVQDTNLICAAVPSQLMAIAALEKGRGAIQPHIDALHLVREQVLDMLDTMSIVRQQRATQQATIARTKGAFYVMVSLPPVPDPLAFNAWMIREHEVATIPGFAFGLDPARANVQRLSYGALDADSVREGVSRFVRACEDWYSR